MSESSQEHRNCTVCKKYTMGIHLNQLTGECDFCLDKRLYRQVKEDRAWAEKAAQAAEEGFLGPEESERRLENLKKNLTKKHKDIK